MTGYTPPLDDMRFALRHVADLGAIGRLPGYAAATPDLVDAILEAAGRFAVNELAPLNQSGDRERSRLENGENAGLRSSDPAGQSFSSRPPDRGCSVLVPGRAVSS